MKRLEEALERGFFVLKNPELLSDVPTSYKHYFSPRKYNDTFDFFIDFNCLLTDKQILSDEKNKDKSIIILRKKDEKQIDILTSNKQCIERANQQLAYQREPIGISITVQCIAYGGSSIEDVSHIEPIASNLNGFLSWSVKVTGINTFEISKRLESTDMKDAEGELRKLRILLIYVAIARKIGVKIERYAISSILRFGPTTVYGDHESVLFNR